MAQASRGAFRLGLGFAALALAAACEPLGPIPGGRLGGREVAEPVADWSFARDAQTIQIETRVGDPHSVTVWCVVHAGRLYVPSRHPENKRWVRNVLGDPRVRVGVGDSVYPGRALRVTDEAELEAVVPDLLAKYGIERPEEEEPDAWLFRIDPPTPAAP